jgi:hypothetical protein
MLRALQTDPFRTKDIPMADQPTPAAAAVAAPAAPAAAAASPAEPPVRPRSWWQWFFLYPAFGLALLSAAPGWVDSAIALMKGVRDATNSELMERHRLYTRNLDCIGAPFQWYREPAQGRIIDATLCPTGDLFVRVRVPDDTSQLATVIDGQKFRERADFVSLDKIVKDADRFAALEVFGMAAQAATLPQSTPALDLSPQGDVVLVQDQFALVVCQTFIDNRNLLRHLQVGGQCFDETVDTYTGVTVSRVPVPCRSSC